MSRRKEKAKVSDNRRLAEGIHMIRVETSLAGDAGPGQFAGIYVNDASMLLMRPISVCDADKEKGIITFVFRVNGAGTAKLAAVKAGESLDILGILGNGYPVDVPDGKRTVILGGGIGIPPLLYLSKKLKAGADVFLGYRNADVFLSDEFGAVKGIETHIATDDGSRGFHGNALEAFLESGIKADIIYACGPLPMLKGVREYALKNGAEAYISLEERMGCGVGACLGCVTKTAETDPHSLVSNARVCREGPVFIAEAVIL